MKSPFKIDFIFEEIEDLLRMTNHRLENIEILLEFLMLPPDLREYKKGREMRRQTLNKSVPESG